MPKRQWTGLRPTLNAQSTSNDYWSQFPQVSASAGDVTAHTFDNRLKAPFFVDGRKKEEMKCLSLPPWPRVKPTSNQPQTRPWRNQLWVASSYWLECESWIVDHGRRRLPFQQHQCFCLVLSVLSFSNKNRMALFRNVRRLPDFSLGGNRFPRQCCIITYVGSSDDI